MEIIMAKLGAIFVLCSVGMGVFLAVSFLRKERARDDLIYGKEPSRHHPFWVICSYGMHVFLGMIAGIGFVMTSGMAAFILITVTLVLFGELPK